MRYIVTCALLALALPGVARAQQDMLEPLEPIEQAAPVAPDFLSQAKAAADRGDSAEALSRYLRVLSQQPDNVAALTGAGRAALDVGDVSAAAGFYARAEEKAPRDGAVKAGLGAMMTQNGNGRAALRFFREALALGVPVSAIAADRGLAYDLVGQQRRAQADYLVALNLQRSDELTRRLALSQAISGDRATALATLDPLLRKQDVPAWRARAFIYAMTGDLVGAERDALAVMQPDQAAAIRPYLVRLAALKPAEKAAAVNFGRFPTAAAQPQPQTQYAARATQPAVRAAQPVPQAGPKSGASPSLAFDGAVTSSAGGTMVGTTSAPPSSPPGFAMPSKAELAAQARADARERAAAKAKADAAAAAKKQRQEEAEQRLAEKRQPARQWVQVAGGANKADLPKAWAKLKAKWPSQLAGKTPWTMHYRFTNRLLIGPFPSDDAAQDYVTERRKEGFDTFRVATPAGTEVERLAIK